LDEYAQGVRAVKISDRLRERQKDLFFLDLQKEAEMQERDTFRIILLLAWIIVGCAPTSNLNRLQLGMSKTETQQAMGGAGTTRGAKTDPSGRQVEILEYVLDNPYTGAEIYWLRFANGKLDQWGRAGDWDERIDQKIDIDVTTKSDTTSNL
jgi:hypothetical protein